VITFANNNHSQIWFQDAVKHLTARNESIASRLMETFRFVDLDKSNAETFSYEYASILRDAGSTFSSVMHAFVIGGTRGQKKTSIADYKNFLTTEDADISSRSLLILPHRNYGTLIPFYGFSKKYPGWWSAYNKIKHSEHAHYKEGNLGNAITSVAALTILEYFIGVSDADNLWANIGIVYPVSDPSYKNRPFLKFE
jgi:hypothetical protein